ncbi:hypothetical protein EFV37_29225 [Mesorhizobium loti]|uniref:Uncharacterized protein n=1 Tax=Mesorhizobium jarvisii TaxID=1777867 RepID=A0A6M7TNW8_9HYPH|nr:MULTISPECIES: hypothetical protein [Mesorhizobium]OBQ68921.1 hypothetical protein A9K72_12075 [Mesorhizobium loti]QKC65886.1 hypothetical protein EB229_29215 [Mesorhizobium jarvisii]QKD11800.1 hypothetical protein EFV37_29225 [Mesorhizobium loti]RJT37906.1 hypothetical protein D3242_01270 [Mesorhizobium jarvisii]
MRRYWVGLESKCSPNGHGEDYREYVEVEDGEDEAGKIHDAIVRLALDLTNMRDGDRIAVHLLPEPMVRE